jgi:predicted TIM-barrel fold metal-dependent hydrolase
MRVIDAQIGVWDKPSDEFPWQEANFGSGAKSGVEARIRQHQTTETNTVEAASAAMDRVGVDAAILSLPMFYGYDPKYAIAAAERHPGRFASTPRFDHRQPRLDERMAELRSRPGILGARIIFLNEPAVAGLRAGEYDALWDAAERHGVPLMVFCPRILEDIHSVARAHPELQLVIDHFGLPQPPLMDADREPFATLPQLLAMAECPNVAVKFSGAPTLSAEKFPFADLWPHLHRVVEAFGPERLIWASDYQRVTDHTYEEALAFVRDTDELSTADKEAILWRSASRLLRWEPFTGDEER